MTDGIAPPSDAQAVVVDLSAREMDVLWLLLEALENTEIAARLGLAADTVKTYILRLSRKLGARNRTDVVIKAYELGLATPGRPRATAEHGLSALSERETAVLLLINHGQSASTIAGRLGLSKAGVRSIVRRIREKWHVHSTAEVVELAREHGLVQAPKLNGDTEAADNLREGCDLVTNDDE